MKTYEKTIGSGSKVKVVMRLMTWAKSNNNWFYARIKETAEGNKLTEFNANKVVNMIESNSASLANLIIKNDLREKLLLDWYFKMTKENQELSKSLFPKFFKSINDNK